MYVLYLSMYFNPNLSLRLKSLHAMLFFSYLIIIKQWL